MAPRYREACEQSAAPAAGAARQAASGAFAEFVAASAELQRVDVGTLSRSARIAFFLNVRIRAPVGPVGTMWDRVGPSGTAARRCTTRSSCTASRFAGRPRVSPRAWPSSAASGTTSVRRTPIYIAPRRCSALPHLAAAAPARAGGLEYSPDDIENGILRGNRPSAASVGALLGRWGLSRGPFAERDPRRAFVVLPYEPRVHFALNCGARSCPPIRVFSEEGLEAELDGAVALTHSPAGTRPRRAAL